MERLQERMQWREAIIIELQERARVIQTEIERQQNKKRETIEELDTIIQWKQEDLEFHLALLHEVGIQNYPDRFEEEEQVEVQTRLADSECSPIKLTRAQYQEQKEKARAWNLDRTRAKDKKRWVWKEDHKPWLSGVQILEQVIIQIKTEEKRIIGMRIILVGTINK